MKNILKAALVVVLSSSTAFAAGAGQGEGLSTLTILFLVFGATILVFQLVPGIALFVSMIRGLFSRKEAIDAVNAGEKN